jgi:hypothetical protein
MSAFTIRETLMYIGCTCGVIVGIMALVILGVYAALKNHERNVERDQRRAK